MPKPGSEGHGKSGHLSDRLSQKAPRRYFTFYFTVLCNRTWVKIAKATIFRHSTYLCLHWSPRLFCPYAYISVYYHINLITTISDKTHMKWEEFGGEKFKKWRKLWQSKILRFYWEERQSVQWVPNSPKWRLPMIILEWISSWEPTQMSPTP